MITVLLPVALLLLTLSNAARARPAEPVFSDTGPDAAAYGATLGYPVPEPPAVRAPRQEEMVGWYSHYDRFRTMRTVPRGPDAPVLLRRPAEEIDVVYPMTAATAGWATTSSATPSRACSSPAAIPSCSSTTATAAATRTASTRSPWPRP